MRWVLVLLFLLYRLGNRDTVGLISLFKNPTESGRTGLHTQAANPSVLDHCPALPRLFCHRLSPWKAFCVTRVLVALWKTALDWMGLHGSMEPKRRMLLESRWEKLRLKGVQRPRRRGRDFKMTEPICFPFSHIDTSNIYKQEQLVIFNFGVQVPRIELNVFLRGWG
jgi:hypothetical protein